MPSKKKKDNVISSRTLAHASSSHSGEKRERATKGKKRKVHLDPKATEPAVNQRKTNEALIYDGSRLKKKRTSHPLEGNFSGVENESDVRERMIEVCDALRSVQTQCEDLVQLILKNRVIMRPSLDLMHDIVLILRKASAVKVLAAVSSLPKVLFIATQKGVGEDIEPTIATKSLVEALLHIAKIQTEDLPDFSAKGRRVRSAFVDDAYVDHTEMEIEAAKKAGQWALQLLSNCVRGVSDDLSRSQSDDHKSQLQHADVSELFVLPRDKLDPVLAKRLIQKSALCLQNRTSTKRSPSRYFACSQLSEAQLNLVLVNPSCTSLLDQLLLNSAKSYISVVKHSAVKEPLELITKVGHYVMQAGEHTFLKLSPLSQMILLRHVEKLRVWYRQVVELALLSKDKFLSAKETSFVCTPIANLVAYDVTVHWDFMDEVRREISRRSEPFTLLSWRLRPFYRAVFPIAFRVIRSETSPRGYKDLYCSNLLPLSKRFPTSFRSIVGFMATADKCFSLFNEAPESAFRTAVLLLKLLRRLLEGNSCTDRTSANVHAFLLCVESILERMSWTCAVGVVRTISEGQKSNHDWKQIIGDMATVISSIDIFRLPGGKSAETVDTVKRKEREVEAFLVHTVVNKCFVFSPKSERVRINSLLAFWLVGLISVEALHEFSDSCKSIGRPEALEILRSLDIVGNWGQLGNDGERYSAVLRSHERLEKKSLSTVNSEQCEW
eukprot:gb/GEZJ01003781.1/.p1 GENE.gb/GEZJ01003781.1/~~gb/GEZJ01003781.1/.p1  ORF type:complete len:723 (-),score=77.31 gb/GEZJ01003781.1/:111-2279(-)